MNKIKLSTIKNMSNYCVSKSGEVAYMYNKKLKV